MPVAERNNLIDACLAQCGVERGGQVHWSSFAASQLLLNSERWASDTEKAATELFSGRTLVDLASRVRDSRQEGLLAVETSIAKGILEQTSVGVQDVFYSVHDWAALRCEFGLEIPSVAK